MTEKRHSYRNPFISSVLFALLYLVISNIFYYVFNGQLYFLPFHYYEWVEYVLGTVTMLVVVLVVEFVRNKMGNPVE